MKDMKRILLFILCFSLLLPFIFAQEKDDEQIEWMKELEKAKAKVRTWDTIEIGGAAAAVVGIALYFVDQEEEITYYGWGLSITEKIKKKGYLIGAAIGTGLGLIGFILAEPARGKVRALELEGKERGYMTVSLVPINKGLAISLKISF